VVRVVLACVCGSDLWWYRGIAEHAHGAVGLSGVLSAGMLGAARTIVLGSAHEDRHALARECRAIEALVRVSEH